jgi:two-component system, OmpR family, torCAD operon response regulator TorR
MKHILLLEDDRGVVDLLSALLEDEGYYISSTASVADATQILQKTKVDLLIADIVPSDGTVFAAIDEAKRRHIAYLLMTGSWPYMAQLEANGELHLTKPLKLKDFTSQVLQRIGPGGRS